jgi:hypothetical protein
MTAPKPRSFPPGPSMLAALAGMGGTGGFTRLPGFLEGVARTYGPVASWRMPRARFWFFDEPALIEGMLTASGYDAIKSRGLRRMRRLLGKVCSRATSRCTCASGGSCNRRFTASGPRATPRR